MTVITRNIGLFAQDATLKPTRRQYPDNIWINATRLKYTERNVSHLHKFNSDEVVSNIWHNSIIIIFARQCYFVVLVIFTLSLSSEKYRSSHISFSSKTNFRLTARARWLPLNGQAPPDLHVDLGFLPFIVDAEVSWYARFAVNIPGFTLCHWTAWQDNNISLINQ